jgi:lantibiotic modifying enzyme
MGYLESAEQVGAWLLHAADRRPEGWTWPVRPTVGRESGTGIWGGMAGPTLFFVEAYRTTGEEKWLEAARHGSRWMESHLDDALAGWAGCGLFTGVGGWALVLDELARASDDDAADRQAARVLEAIMAAAEVEDGRVSWHGLSEILWGTSGIGCLLLRVGRDRVGDRALELATGAGDWLIDYAEEAPPGIRWGLGPAYDRDFPGRAATRFPNFAHGTAGIAFFLARLAAATDDVTYLDAARAGMEWVLSTVRAEADTCAAFHHEPDGTDLYTLGWCHGPPGLAWAFRQLELCTDDHDDNEDNDSRPRHEWRALIRRAANADRFSGIPEQRQPGFWDNVGRCCGSAGVVEFFLDLHRLEGRDDDLRFARVMVDDLLTRAVVDQNGMRWSNYEFRDPEPTLPPETTYMQGAAGIGSTLLRLHRHLSGDDWVVPWPHAPTWDFVGSAAVAR